MFLERPKTGSNRPLSNGHINIEGNTFKNALKGDDRLKKKLMVLALALTLTAVFAGTTAAAVAGSSCECPDRASSPDLNRMPIAEKLNLSDRQVQQLKEINLSTYQAAKPIKSKLADARFELRQLRIDGKDKAAIQAKTKEIQEYRDQLGKLRQQKHQKIQSILTSEQQDKLKTLKGSGHHGGWSKQGHRPPE